MFFDLKNLFVLIQTEKGFTMREKHEEFQFFSCLKITIGKVFFCGAAEKNQLWKGKWISFLRALTDFLVGIFDAGNLGGIGIFNELNAKCLGVIENFLVWWRFGKSSSDKRTIELCLKTVGKFKISSSFTKFSFKLNKIGLRADILLYPVKCQSI